MVDQYLRVAQISVICCLMFLVSGCFTYHPSSSRNLEDEDTYSLIDSMTKISAIGWEGPNVSKVGANRQGYMFMKTVETKQSGNRITYYGTPVFYPYSDIVDVEVRVVLAGIILCGITDPTQGSSVVVTLKDGTHHQFKFDRIGGLPFLLWLFRSEWRCAHLIGQAFQNARMQADPNANNGVQGVMPDTLPVNAP